MTPLTDSPPGRSVRLSKRVYLPRAVGLGLGGLCVGAALLGLRETPAWLWALLLANALIWPHVAYFRATRAAHPRHAEKTNLFFDSLMGGFWVLAMQANLMPSVLVIAMLSMNNVATGGLRFLALGVLAHVLGAAAGWAVFGWQPSLASGLVVQLACIPMLVVYPMLIGLVTLRLAHQLNAKRAELRWLSENDDLSGIFNRRFIERRIAQEFENFKRHGAAVALAVADIDHFKRINDSHGHVAGDAAIRLTGQVLTDEIRVTDAAARLGGDEFVVLMPFTNADDALALTQRLQRAFAELIADDPRLTGTTLSFGIASPHPAMHSHAEWLELADRALYRAKARVRGSVELAGAH